MSAVARRGGPVRPRGSSRPRRPRSCVVARWARWVCSGWSAWLAVLWLWAAPALAREVPPLQGRVTDEAALLSPSEARQLEQRLAAYEQATGRQLAVLTVESLQGDPIEDFSIRVVEAWALGREGQDDGLLLLLAEEDRKVRIEVGYGLEGEVTDLVAARIIHDVMRPYLRAGRYGEAITAGVDALIVVAGPTTEPPPEPGPEGFWSRQWLGRSGLWYVLMGGVLLAVLVVCWWRPLLGVIAVLVMSQLWWPMALVGGLALWLRWRWSQRRRLRDGYGVERAPAAPSEGGGAPWRGLGMLALLAGAGRMLSSREGGGVTSGLARTIGSRGVGSFIGRGGGFGGGGASGGW